MWFLTAARDARTAVIPTAIRVNSCLGPPASSAHAPAYGDTTPPTRPKATAVPTPVARMPVGYTCAASAYIVVCTALMRPPVHASIARIPNADCAPIDTLASSAAPAIAPPDIVSIVIREPNRPIRIAPRMAPTTPPKLNAVRPLLATPAPKPAVFSSDGTQFTPTYTERRQKKKEPQRASVSRRNSGTRSDDT